MVAVAQRLGALQTQVRLTRPALGALKQLVGLSQLHRHHLVPRRRLAGDLRLARLNGQALRLRRR